MLGGPPAATISEGPVGEGGWYKVEDQRFSTEFGAPGPARGRYPMLRNNASGTEIGLPGRIAAVFLSGTRQNRTSGWPDSRF